jgi:hypothetical protein
VRFVAACETSAWPTAAKAPVEPATAAALAVTSAAAIPARVSVPSVRELGRDTGEDAGPAVAT